jgi:hypothetical protein
MVTSLLNRCLLADGDKAQKDVTNVAMKHLTPKIWPQKIEGGTGGVAVGGGETENQNLSGKTGGQWTARRPITRRDLRNSRCAAQGTRRARLHLLEEHGNPAEGGDEKFPDEVQWRRAKMYSCLMRFSSWSSPFSQSRRENTLVKIMKCDTEERGMLRWSTWPQKTKGNVAMKHLTPKRYFCASPLSAADLAAIWARGWGRFGKRWIINTDPDDFDRLNRWQPVVFSVATSKLSKRLVTDLIEFIAEDQVPERPFRREPRAVKRRPKPHQLLNKPRHEMVEISHRSRYTKAKPENITNEA